MSAINEEIATGQPFDTPTEKLLATQDAAPRNDTKKRLSVEEKVALIAKMGMGELQLRRGLINGAIRVCMEAGDPQDQIGNYRAQLKRIDDEIKKRKGKNDSDGVRIDAKPGTMGAKGVNL